MSTVVKLKCLSKKQSKNYGYGDAKANPTAHAIEFGVEYDPKSVYYNLSGGTNPTLNTVSDVVAGQFTIGKDYKMTLEDWLEETEAVPAE
ncbi:hypothetical protein HQ865_01220 [Mucilaginibacter mali]|uniref:Uncharacterized protein n=1 Tax=Mucilaginibacter mali TaxID=2740462 RepID=A0A7D4TSM6_9SPHI|nr:hypothetical protein [Mucilaginibacter mali]QKJ28435.1 hypothetical protein HQ865_01220 [Mucilaginibacter mali]